MAFGVDRGLSKRGKNNMSEWFEIEDQEDVELSKDGRSIEILFNSTDQGNQYVDVPIEFIRRLLGD